MRGKAYVVGDQRAESRGVTGMDSTLGILQFVKFPKISRGGVSSTG